MIGDREKPRRLTLPPEEALPRVDAITVNARATWFALLGLLAFVGVTLLGVEDIDFFDASRRTDLPLVGVSVPTLTFFYVAPALTAAVYAYFHFYLMKLWDALAEAPATVKGRRLGDLVHPWLVTDAALWFRRHEGATADRPLRLVSGFTAGALTWGFGWAVLGYAWWRSHTAHLEWMSLWLLALFVFSLWVGVSSLHAAWRRVGHGETRVRHHGKWPRRAVLAAAVPLAMVSWMRTEGGIEAPSIWVSDKAHDWGAVALSERLSDHLEDYRTSTTQERERIAALRREEAAARAAFDERYGALAAEERSYMRHRRIETGWFSTPWLSELAVAASPSWMFEAYKGPLGKPRIAAILAHIDLVEGRIVEKPEGWLDFKAAEADFRADWCKRRERPVSVCVEPAAEYDGKPIPIMRFGDEGEPDADALDARKAERGKWCKGRVSIENCEAFFEREEGRLLADWKERRGEYLSTLTRPSLKGRDLRGADLTDAFLPGLDLRGARMEGAILRGARLEGANLEEARMEGADLARARMEGADLSKARMDGVQLIEARMEGAELTDARIRGAILALARMERASFFRARMEGADLLRARMAGADFRQAQMEGVSLRVARMEGADLRGARMEDGDLSWASMEGANLGGARMGGADLSWANLKSADLTRWNNARTNARSADFTGARDMTQDHVNAMLGDRATILPEGLRRTDLMNRELPSNQLARDHHYEAWLAAGAPPGKATGPW